MRKNFTATVLAVLATVGIPGSAAARELSPEEAFSRVRFGSQFKSASITRHDVRLAHSEEDDGHASFYVFDMCEENGFLIVSADDQFVPLLGYSFSGKFDYSDMPPSLRWWLGEYRREMRETRSLNRPVSGNPGCHHAADDYPEISPMLTTTWNQDAPYNNLCPDDGQGRSVTGCVATAMAQVVAFHRWPETTGIGSHSYYWNGRNLMFDYDSTVFDWENMLDNYDGSATERQCEAVATLMYGCGVSVDMMYSSYMSGAYSHLIGDALTDYFGYDSAASYLMRDYYKPDEWDGMVYNELAHGRPVIYAGAGDGGGHQFVCDGYGEDGYFHFNWGWGGYCDGYFRLSALDPIDVGIGGGSGGFNYNQSVVVGVGRPGEVEYSRIYPVVLDGGFATAGYEQNDSLLEVAFVSDRDDSGFYNFSEKRWAGYMGVRIEDENGGVSYAEGSEVEFPAGSVEGFYGIGGYYVSIDLDGFLPGKYAVTPVFRSYEGEWSDIHCLSYCVGVVEMEIEENGVASLRQGMRTENYTVKVVDFHTEHEILVSDEFNRFYFTVENGENPFDDYIILNVKMEDNASDIMLLSFPVSLDAGGREEYEYEYMFYAPDGSYEIYFSNPYDEMISDVYTVVVGKRDNGSQEGVELPEMDDSFDVYTIGGTCVARAIDRNTVFSLPENIYILRGRKGAVCKMRR